MILFSVMATIPLAGGIQTQGDEVTFIYHFVEGWNQITLPLEVENNSFGYLFEDLIDTDKMLHFCYQYDSDAGHYILTDHLEPGIGYHVYLYEDINHSISGEPITTDLSIDLFEGNNLIGWIHDDPVSAEHICASMPGCTSVAILDDPIDATYLVYTPGDDSNNFDITKGMGFWVVNSVDSVWDGGAYTSDPDSPPSAGNTTPKNGETIVNTTFEKADVNDDGEINILDLTQISLHFGETGSPGWIPADVDDDGEVDSVDLALVVWVWTGVPDMVLEVFVDDPDGEVMDVYFYDASDDSLLGIDVGVLDEETATFQWSNLESEVLYEWYVLIDDGDEFVRSDTWSFKFTEQEETEPKLEVSIDTGFGLLFDSVNAYVENTGDAAASNINLSIYVEYGFLGHKVNSSVEFSVLEPDVVSDSLVIEDFRGFGPITVTAKAFADDVETVETIASGWIIGRFIILIF